MSGGLALVLSGGGAPAAFFGTGVIQYLEEQGLRDEIAVVSGTSGAINAGGLAVGMTAGELVELWGEVAEHDLGRLRRDVWRLVNWRNALRWPSPNLVEYVLDAVGWHWLVDTTPARRWLVVRLCGEDDRGDGLLPIRDGVAVVVSSVDQCTGKVVRFTNTVPPRGRRADDSGDKRWESPYASAYEFRMVQLTVDHLLGSAAVPLLCRPTRLGRGEYVDAGLVANTPLTPVFDYEPDAVIVVSAATVSRSGPSPVSLGDAIGRLAENVARYAVYSSYEYARAINELAEQAPDVPRARGKRKVHLALVEPDELEFTLTGFLDFSRSAAERLIEHGWAQAHRALRGWPAPGRVTTR
jgi:NTE family protein